MAAAEPQIAARDWGENPRVSGRRDRAHCGSDRAALSPKNGPQALRHEYLDNIQSEPSAKQQPRRDVELPKATKRSQAEFQRIQCEIVEKLGNGDIEKGWLIFGDLSGHQRRQLEGLAAEGRLMTDLIATVCGQISHASANGVSR
jgi:hypothetical protein